MTTNRNLAALSAISSGLLVCLLFLAVPAFHAAPLLLLTVAIGGALCLWDRLTAAGVSGIPSAASALAAPAVALLLTWLT